MFVKKYSHLVLMALLSFSVAACSDDDAGDTSAPTVAIAEETTTALNAGVEAGSTITVTGTITDETSVEYINLLIEDAGGNVLYDEEWDDVNQASYALNESITIPADADEGMATMTLTTDDGAGNEETQTWTFMINAPAEPNARFTVTVPSGTPENAEVFIVGDFTPNGWESDDSDDRFMLTRNTDGTYSGDFVLPEGEAQQFRFRIRSDDSSDLNRYIEVDAECTALTEDFLSTDRSFTATGTLQTTTYTVANWNNMGDCVE